MNFSIKKLITVLGVMLLGLALVGCNTKGTKDASVATVNKKSISKKALDERLNMITAAQPKAFEGKEGKKRKEDYKKRLLDSMIMEELLIEEAQRLGLKIDKKDIKKRAKEVMKQIPEQMRKQQDITPEKIEESMERQMTFSFLQQKLSKGVKVTDAEIKAYYNTNKQQFPKQTLAQAKETITRVLQGQKVGEKMQNLALKLRKKAKVEISN